MTEYRTQTGFAEDPTRDRPEQAKQEAAATKDEARRQAGETAQTAKAQAGEVAGEAKAQARNVVAEAKRVGVSRADEQARSAAGALRQAQQQTQALLDGRTEEAGALGDYARQLTEALGRYADRIDELGFEGIVRETSNFARRRPAAFLLATAGAGLVVGRLGRGIKDAPNGDRDAFPRSSEPAAALPPATTAVTAPAPESDVIGTPEPLVPSRTEEETSTRDEEGTWR